MTILPVHKSTINLDKEIYRDGVKNLMFTLEGHANIAPFLHLDIIYPQKILVKIVSFEDSGSIKDLINNINVSKII
jgi:hypothetical protein